MTTPDADFWCEAYGPPPPEADPATWPRCFVWAATDRTGCCSVILRSRLTHRHMAQIHIWTLRSPATCGTCHGHGEVPDGDESGQPCPDCGPQLRVIGLPIYWRCRGHRRPF